MEMSDQQREKDLEIYLRDHYAGAVSALELLGHLIEAHEQESLGDFFRELRADIRTDHEQLHNLMEALGFEESSLRNAGAWMGEKLARLKVGISPGEDARLRLLQALESLLLGITGKKLLWRALAVVQESSPILRRTDLAEMESRAVEQSERVEAQRLRAAQDAFASS
jgi:hypothetical protein